MTDSTPPPSGEPLESDDSAFAPYSDDDQAQRSGLGDDVFQPTEVFGVGAAAVATGTNNVASEPEVPSESSFVRARSARRRWRRRLAGLLLGAFVLGWLGFGATIYRNSFEQKQEKRVKAALGSGEFAGIRYIADGRKIILEGSVASAADAQTATDLVRRVRYVKGIDTSKLQIGGSAGRILPLTAVYTEGRVSFEGARPSEAALQALVKAASAGLGDANVATQFAEPTGAGGDVDAYAALGAAFARFPAIGVRSATIDVTDTDATVTGRVADDAGRSELVQTLSSATSRTVIDNLELEVSGSPVSSVPGSTAAGAPTDTTVDASSTTTVSTLEPAALATLQEEINATLKASRIEFTTDSAALGAQAKAIIADLAKRILPTGASFEVGGHTDSRGRADRNLALSQRRADAVRDEFVAQGIPVDRVTATGYGSQKTVAPDNDSRGNPLNRRIEITLK